MTLFPKIKCYYYVYFKKNVTLSIRKKNILINFVTLKITMMKNYLFIFIMSLLFASCHENIEKRAERETKEFTRKNCPMRVSEYITNDSLVFEKDTRTIHYYYSMNGMADTTAIDKEKAQNELVKGVRNSTAIRVYKKNKFNFAYTYFSTKNKGQVLIDVKISPKQYEAK